MGYNLFLDDVRTPENCFTYVKAFGIRPDTYLGEWVIARNYTEFVATIETRGLPSIVSFDHDLAEEHYDPDMWSGTFNYWENTGYECVKWLIEYCELRGLVAPVCYCHSMNPVGRERINNLLKNWKA